jgi:hypothetical protein
MGSRRRHATEQEAAPRRAVLQRSEEPGNGVLELQRSAGNKAVAERLEVARDGPVAADAPASTEKTFTAERLPHPLTLLSLSMHAPGPGTGSTGTQREIHEVTVTARAGDLLSFLMQADAEGRSLGDGDIVMGTTTLHMTKILVSSLQLPSGDSDVVSFTLDFETIEFRQQQEKDTGDEGGAPRP